LDATVLQGIVTHFSPLTVLCCVVQSLLICQAMKHHHRVSADSQDTPLKVPTLETLAELIQGPWRRWISATQNPMCQ